MKTLTINNFKILSLKEKNEKTNKIETKFLLFFEKKEKNLLNWSMTPILFDKKFDIINLIYNLKNRFINMEIIYQPYEDNYFKGDSISPYIKVKEDIELRVNNIEKIVNEDGTDYLYNSEELLENKKNYINFQSTLENMFEKKKETRFENFLGENFPDGINSSSKYDRGKAILRLKNKKRDYYNKNIKQNFRLYKTELIVDKCYDEFRYLFTKEFTQDFVIAKNEILHKIKDKTKREDNILKLKNLITHILEDESIFLKSKEKSNLDPEIIKFLIEELTIYSGHKLDPLKILKFFPSISLDLLNYNNLSSFFTRTKNNTIELNSQLEIEKEQEEKYDTNAEETCLYLLKNCIDNIDNKITLATKRKLYKRLIKSSELITVKELKKIIPHNIFMNDIETSGVFEEDLTSTIEDKSTITILMLFYTNSIEKIIKEHFPKIRLINSIMKDFNISHLLFNKENIKKILKENINKINKIGIPFEMTNTKLNEISENIIESISSKNAIENIKFLKNEILENKNVRLDLEVKNYLEVVLGVKKSSKINYMVFSEKPKSKKIIDSSILLKDFNQFDLI